jgi:hypothetical protein
MPAPVLSGEPRKAAARRTDRIAGEQALEIELPAGAKAKSRVVTFAGCGEGATDLRGHAFIGKVAQLRSELWVTIYGEGPEPY